MKIMEITTTDMQFSPKELQVLTQAGIIPANTPAAQVMLFAQVSKSRNLSPFNKEIYLVGYGGNYSIIVGIDGFRAIANRTGLLCGMDEPQFDKKGDGSYKTIADFNPNERPKTCTVTVYKLVNGIRCPFTHVVSFSEFSSGKQKWASMPFQMIAKVAEAFALRKAFGGEFEGIRSEEEVPAIMNDTVEIRTEKPAINDDQFNNLKKRVTLMSCDELVEAARDHFILTDSQIETIKSWYNV